jgi:phage terminase Nu1 subunit (DNA packaging protein)
MDETSNYRFDPVDLEQMRLLVRLSPGQRIRVMLDARELAVGLIRGRLRRQYPHLSTREINLKVLEEIARDERTSSRP